MPMLPSLHMMAYMLEKENKNYAASTIYISWHRTVFLVSLPDLLSNTTLTISVDMQLTFCLWSIIISTSEGRMLQPKQWADWELTDHLHSGVERKGVMVSRNPKRIRHPVSWSVYKIHVKST